MCGYCTEGEPIEIVRRQAETSLLKGSILSAVYYLQECDDVNLALPEIGQLILDSINAATSHYTVRHSLLTIVFCRLVETLVVHGFESEDYQALLRQNIVLSVIDYQTTLSFPDDRRFFQSGSVLTNLTRQEIFLIKDKWDAFITNGALLPECISLLNAYVEWWHTHDTKGAGELDLFRAIYPYVFFSLMLLTKYEPHNGVIQRLVVTNPAAPLFEGLELWLQRRAALVLYKALGLDVFLSYGRWVRVDKVRPALIYYLLVRQQLNSDERQQVRKIVSSNLGALEDVMLDREGSSFSSPFSAELRILEYIGNS